MSTPPVATLANSVLVLVRGLTGHTTEELQGVLHSREAWPENPSDDADFMWNEHKSAQIKKTSLFLIHSDLFNQWLIDTIGLNEDKLPHFVRIGLPFDVNSPPTLLPPNYNDFNGHILEVSNVPNPLELAFSMRRPIHVPEEYKNLRPKTKLQKLGYFLLEAYSAEQLNEAIKQHFCVPKFYMPRCRFLSLCLSTWLLP